MSNFKVGDIVRLKTGRAPMRITHIWEDRRTLFCSYINTKHKIMDRSMTSFTYHEKHYEKDGKKMTKYKIKGFNYDWHLIGTLLNGNAKMQRVDNPLLFLETKYSNISKIMPYTISVKFEGSCKTYSYFAEKGKFKLWDNLLVDGSKAKVVGTDTNSSKAMVHIHGYKLEKILQPHET